MSNELQGAKAVFGKAVEIESPEDRSAYLDEACADPQMRAEVEELLSAIQRAGSFMSRPILEPQDTADRGLIERPGTVIGSHLIAPDRAFPSSRTS